MCLLCGEFVSGPHWTDRHVEDKARDKGADDGGYTQDRRRDRAHRASPANAVVRFYGVRVKD